VVPFVYQCGAVTASHDTTAIMIGAGDDDAERERCRACENANRIRHRSWLVASHKGLFLDLGKVLTRAATAGESLRIESSSRSRSGAMLAAPSAEDPGDASGVWKPGECRSLG
jgi:hypothetical protein